MIEPRLDWARGKAPLLNGAFAKLEVYLSPVVQTADKYIDMTSEGLSKAATGIKMSVAGRVAPVQHKVVDVKNSAVSKATGVKDFSVMKVEGVVCIMENAIDRLLPPPAKVGATEKKGIAEEQAKAALIPRIAHLPFRVPLRVTMIVYVKGCGAVDTVIVGGRRVKSLAWEKQMQLAQLVQQRSKPLTDKVCALSEPVMLGLQKRKAAAYGAVESGHQAIVVKVYVVTEKFQPARDWSSRKVDDILHSAATAARSSARLAHAVTVRVAGEQRAAFVFTRIGERMPALKLADETISQEMEQKSNERIAEVHEETPGSLVG